KKMHKKILQKALVALTYSKLKMQIQILEDTRKGEKNSTSDYQETKDKYDDRISQRSISLALKGDQNPNWLNDIFRENKDIGLSNYISILAYIKEKYRDFLLEKQFVLTDFLTEDLLEMGDLLDQYIVESTEPDFDLEEFFQAYSDSEFLLDELTEILGEFAMNGNLTEEETESVDLLLSAITVDYSEREQLDDNIEGDGKDEI
ncbi:hypothetical protein F6335_RS12230, partial [Enterococcus hirae]